MGRPKLPPDEGRNVSRTIRLTGAEDAAFREAAWLRGESVTRMLVGMVDRWLRRNRLRSPAPGGSGPGGGTREGG
jgi:hypothetical protein